MKNKKRVELSANLQFITPRCDEVSVPGSHPGPEPPGRMTHHRLEKENHCLLNLFVIFLGGEGGGGTRCFYRVTKPKNANCSAPIRIVEEQVRSSGEAGGPVVRRCGTRAEKLQLLSSHPEPSRADPGQAGPRTGRTRTQSSPTFSAGDFTASVCVWGAVGGGARVGGVTWDEPHQPQTPSAAPHTVTQLALAFFWLIWG